MKTCARCELRKTQEELRTFKGLCLECHYDLKEEEEE